MHLAFAKYNSTLCRVCMKSARLSWALCFWYHIVLVNITLTAQWPQHTLHFVWAWLLKTFSCVCTEEPFLWLEKRYDEIQGSRLLSGFESDVCVSHLHVAGVSLWKPLCSVLFKQPSASWLMAEIHFKADLCVTGNLKLYLPAVFSPF